MANALAGVVGDQRMLVVRRPRTERYAMQLEHSGDPWTSLSCRRLALAALDRVLAHASERAAGVVGPLRVRFTSTTEVPPLHRLVEALQARHPAAGSEGLDRAGDDQPQYR